MANISAVLEFSLSAIRLIHALNYGCYMFDEILCNHFEYNCINCMKHVRVI